MGLGGINQHIIAVNRFPPDDPRNIGGPAGVPGQYRTIFVLGRPGFPLSAEHERLPADQVRGDSHLMIKSGQFDIEGEIESGSYTFLGTPNDQGYLAKLTLASISADNFQDAMNRAYFRSSRARCRRQRIAGAVPGPSGPARIAMHSDTVFPNTIERENRFWRKDMSIENNKAIAERFVRVFNRGDMDAVSHIFAHGM
jgi:hypothetical protein